MAVSEALQSSSYVVTAGMAADNLICAIYFTSLFALAAGLEPDKDATSSNGYEPSPESGQLSFPGFPIHLKYFTFSITQDLKLTLPWSPLSPPDSQVVLSPLSLSLALSASAILCTAGNLLVEYFEIPGGSLPVITAAVVLLATVFPKQVGKLSGPGEVLAAVLLQVFFQLEFLFQGFEIGLSVVMSNFLWRHFCCVVFHGFFFNVFVVLFCCCFW